MDLTTKFGRQQAHAAGGQGHRVACLIEEALAADDRERNDRAIEVLVELSDEMEPGATFSVTAQQLLDLALNILRGKA